MSLYLVQHGKALPKERDPDQRLSEEGKEEVRRIAEAARKYEVDVGRIEHSTKVRARETAEILSAALKPSGGMKEREGIKPMDDVTAVAGGLNSGENLMLVGHLPFMERLTAYLVTGSQDETVVKFQNGGIVCLDKSPDARNWFVKWTLVPKIK